MARYDAISLGQLITCNKCLKSTLYDFQTIDNCSVSRHFGFQTLPEIQTTDIFLQTRVWPKFAWIFIRISNTWVSERRTNKFGFKTPGFNPINNIFSSEIVFCKKQDNLKTLIFSEKNFCADFLVQLAEADLWEFPT